MYYENKETANKHNGQDIQSEHKEHIESWGETGEKLHRFEMPEGIYRVTAGKGGESFLIDGGEEVAIYDCGMAYCSDGVISDIEDKLKEIGHEKLDKIILSHSHYDHIGALPYILDRWPCATVIGGKKLVKVFASDRAKATMERLGKAARDKYIPGEASKPESERMVIRTDNLRVDQVLEDGDIFDIGKYEVTAIHTPGHTDCSFSYYLREKGPEESEQKQQFDQGLIEDDGKSIISMSENEVGASQKHTNGNGKTIISMSENEVGVSQKHTNGNGKSIISLSENAVGASQKHTYGDGKTIIFVSESVGVLEDEDHVHTAILKSFDDTITSARKCKAYNADIIIGSHYGVVPPSIGNDYYDMYIKAAEKEKAFILAAFDGGKKDLDSLYQAYEDEYWVSSRVGAQPIEAFQENALITIKLITRDYRNAEL